MAVLDGQAVSIKVSFLTFLIGGYLLCKSVYSLSSRVLLAIQTTLRAGPMPGNRWSTQNKLNGNFGEFFCLIILYPGIFFYLLDILFILWFLILDFDEISMCVNPCVFFL